MRNRIWAKVAKIGCFGLLGLAFTLAVAPRASAVELAGCTPADLSVTYAGDTGGVYSYTFTVVTPCDFVNDDAIGFDDMVGVTGASTADSVFNEVLHAPTEAAFENTDDNESISSADDGTLIIDAPNTTPGTVNLIFGSVDDSVDPPITGPAALAVAAPEPGALALTGIGLLGLLLVMRKRKAQGLAHTT